MCLDCFSIIFNLSSWLVQILRSIFRFLLCDRSFFSVPMKARMLIRVGLYIASKVPPTQIHTVFFTGEKEFHKYQVVFSGGWCMESLQMWNKYWVICFLVILFWFTLPETNSSPLKMDGWNAIVSFWGPAYFPVRLLFQKTICWNYRGEPRCVSWEIRS